MCHCHCHCHCQISVLNADPIAETESLREFVDFLQTTPLADEPKSALVRAMETRFSIASAPLVHELETLADPHVVPYVEADQEVLPPSEPAKRDVGEHAQVRTAEVGADPRAKRAELPSSMRPGFYLCFSGQKGIRALHRFGSCYALLGIDHLRYENLGATFPPVASIRFASYAVAAWTTRMTTLMCPSLPRRQMNSSRLKPTTSGAANASPGDADVVVPASKKRKSCQVAFPKGVNTPLFLILVFVGRGGVLGYSRG